MGQGGGSGNQGGGQSGGGKSGGQSSAPRPPNGPSTTGKPSGDGRGNNPPKK